MMLRILLFIVNWFFILTANFWGGFLIWFLFFKESKTKMAKDIFAGKKFIFEDFDQ